MSREPEQGVYKSNYAIRKERDPNFLEKHRKLNRDYYYRNRQRVLEREKCFRMKYRDKLVEELREKRRKLKEEIFNLLGNKCARCGFNDTRILQIDHVNGGGMKEFRSFHNRWQSDYLKHVLEEVKKGTGKYQLLCPNCNWIKRIENKEDRFHVKRA